MYDPHHVKIYMVLLTESADKHVLKRRLIYRMAIKNGAYTCSLYCRNVLRL